MFTAKGNGNVLKNYSNCFTIRCIAALSNIDIKLHKIFFFCFIFWFYFYQCLLLPPSSLTKVLMLRRLAEPPKFLTYFCIYTAGTHLYHLKNLFYSLLYFFLCCLFFVTSRRKKTQKSNYVTYVIFSISLCVCPIPLSFLGWYLLENISSTSCSMFFMASCQRSKM